MTVHKGGAREDYGADCYRYPPTPWQWLVRAVAASPDNAGPASAGSALLYGRDSVSRAYFDCRRQHGCWPGTGWDTHCPRDSVGRYAGYQPHLARYCGVGPRGGDLTTRHLRPGGGGISQS